MVMTRLSLVFGVSVVVASLPLVGCSGGNRNQCGSCPDPGLGNGGDVSGTGGSHAGGSGTAGGTSSGGSTSNGGGAAGSSAGGVGNAGGSSVGGVGNAGGASSGGASSGSGGSTGGVADPTEVSTVSGWLTNAIKGRFATLLGGLPTPDPFADSVAPEPKKYCR